MYSLEQLVQDLLEQSGLGALSPLALGILPSIKAWGLNKLTGTEADLFRASDFLSKQTAAGMVQRKFRAIEYASMYGNAAKEADEEFGRQAAIGVFKSLGYSQSKATVAAGGNLGRLIAGVAEWQNPTQAGVSAITSALYNRRQLFRVSPGGEMEGYTSQAHSGRRMVSGLLDAYNTQEFGRLSFSDVGTLASRVIQTGALDVASTGEGKQDTRLTRIKARIKEYSGSLDKLKDVIDGDMSKILDSMDKLFGGTTIAMSTAKLANITTSIQHAALVTGTDAKTLAQNAGLGYSYIASVGGTQGMGVRMGVEAAYYTQALPSDARLSKDEMRSATLMALANKTRSGEARNLATAYVAWKNQQPENSKQTSLSDYLKTLGNQPLTNETFIKSAYTSLRKQYKGATDDQLAALYSSLSTSSQVLDEEETGHLGSTLVDATVNNLIKYRKASLRKFYDKYRSTGAVRQKSYEEFERQVTGGDIYARSEIMERNLQSLTSDAQAQIEGGRLIRNFGHTEQRLLGVGSSRQAQELMRSSRQAGVLREQKLYYDTLDTNIQKLITRANKNSNSTLEAFVEAADVDKEGLQSVSDLVSRMMRVDVSKFKGEQLTGALEQVRSSLQLVGHASTSPLTGLRKVNGVEGAKQELKAREEYTKLSVSAVGVIKKAAAGAKLTAADKKTLKDWSEATDLSVVQEAVYQNLNQDMAKKLLNPKEKDSVFAEVQRLHDIAKSGMADVTYKAHGAAFVKEMYSAQQRFAQARRENGVEINKVLNMTEEARAQYLRKHKENRAVVGAVEAVRGIEQAVNASKLNAEAKASILEQVKASGGSVESLLATIIQLLTTISNKN